MVKLVDDANGNFLWSVSVSGASCGRGNKTGANRSELRAVHTHPLLLLPKTMFQPAQKVPLKKQQEKWPKIKKMSPLKPKTKRY